MRILSGIAMLIGMFSLFACGDHDACTPLPILGERQYVAGDTLFHTIPDFVFLGQDSQLVTPATFEGKIYAADFFFISCPTICPKVKQQMLRLYDTFKEEPRLLLLSHSIDVRHDTVPRLKAFSTKLGVDGDKWLFVTGEEDALFGIADQYFSIARRDEDAPGGFDHSGRIILVDQLGRVRSFCDGTDEQSVDLFMRDIRCLLDEMD
jgi:protein SCO1/2